LKIFLLSEFEFTNSRWFLGSWQDLLKFGVGDCGFLQLQASGFDNKEKARFVSKKNVKG